MMTKLMLRWKILAMKNCQAKPREAVMQVHEQKRKTKKETEGDLEVCCGVLAEGT
jgi:hypothetical protein